MNNNLRSIASDAWRYASRESAVLLIALLQFALHLWVAAHDNLFRDELYYIAASHHLGFGFVEYPPGIALITAGARLLFGNSLMAYRLLPAIAAAIIVLLTADMVAMLGGGRLARILAALAVGLGPVFIGSSGLLTMDPFDQLWWSVCAWTLIRLIKADQPRLWLLFGLFAGLGLQTKLTIGFYIGALVLGLLLSDRRRLLFNRWLIFGGLIALLIVSPYIIWNVQHGFPTLEYTRAYSGGKTFQATPPEFFMQQVITTNPLALPLWLGGLFFLFFTAAGKPYRAFGWAYVFLFVFFMIERAKFYWLSPSYPALLAAGSFGLQLLVEQRAPLKWLQPAYASLIALTGLMLVPFAIPILPPEVFIRLNAQIGGAGEVKAENLVSSALPQSYADRYGWREMVDKVKAAYDTLTPQEKADACIFGDNYGEAGAVDYYGPALGLPRAISGHNSYWIWGPQGCTGKVLITINAAYGDMAPVFESVEPSGETECQYCMPFENHAKIYIARGLKAPLGQAWPGTKDYN